MITTYLELYGWDPYTLADQRLGRLYMHPGEEEHMSRIVHQKGSAPCVCIESIENSNSMLSSDNVLG